MLNCYQSFGVISNTNKILQVGLKNCTSPDTRLTYMTVGVFLQQLINSKNMNMYTHVILDEIHERDQTMDFTMIIVKKLLNSVSQHVKVNISDYFVEIYDYGLFDIF